MERAARNFAWFLIWQATLSAFSGTRTHYYPLNGTYADEMGGSQLLPNGGLITLAGCSFPVDGGPSLASAIEPEDYSIEMIFSIKETSSYRKIIDFKDRVSDAGLYNLSGVLNFYPMASGTNVVFTNNIPVHLVLTRDGRTRQASGFVNGVLQWAVTDTLSNAVFSAAANVIHFFRDDLATGKSEATGGFIGRVQIFAGALTAAEAQALFDVRRPELRIAESFRNVQVEWTNIVPVYRLEGSAAIGPAALWRETTNQTITNGLVHSVVIPTSNTAAFFRLRRWR